LQAVLRARGFASLIEVFSPGTGREVVRHFQSLRVEAVIFIGHFPTAEIEARLVELNALGTPSVVIDHFGLKGANTVTLDRAAGMELVVAHLCDLGHRSFGSIGLSHGPVNRISRMNGVGVGLAARGLDVQTALLSLDQLHDRSDDFEYGRALARSYVEQPQLPTAFLGFNDEIAIGALRGFQEAGLRIPGDVSVTGFNNQEIGAMTWPSLTTIDQNIDRTVEVAAEVALAQIEKPIRTKPIVRTIEPKLVIRESTGPRKD
jgi:DNA-binding LacI/PurR family transcriptional regulator